jgi:hypothetical protein
VLVERGDALRGHLAAEPVGLLKQGDAFSSSGCSNGRRDAAGPAAGDENLAVDIAHWGVPRNWHDSRAHDVDYFIMV